MSVTQSDAISAALDHLVAEAERAGIPWQAVPDEPRRCGFVVAFPDGRGQPVVALTVRDDDGAERLQLVAVVGEPPDDARLLCKLLYVAGEGHRARLAALSPERPELCVSATFVAAELDAGCGPRLVEAMQEVAALADVVSDELAAARTH